jgi:hypothetical protein
MRDVSRCLTLREWRAVPWSSKPGRVVYAPFRTPGVSSTTDHAARRRKLRAQLDALDERLALAGGDP